MLFKYQKIFNKVVYTIIPHLCQLSFYKSERSQS